MEGYTKNAKGEVQSLKRKKTIPKSIPLIPKQNNPKIQGKLDIVHRKKQISSENTKDSREIQKKNPKNSKKKISEPSRKKVINPGKISTTSKAILLKEYMKTGTIPEFLQIKFIDGNFTLVKRDNPQEVSSFSTDRWSVSEIFIQAIKKFFSKTCKIIWDKNVFPIDYKGDKVDKRNFLLRKKTEIGWFLNPPYSRIDIMINHFFKIWTGAFCVFILPKRQSSVWFKQAKAKSNCLIIDVLGPIFFEKFGYIRMRPGHEKYILLVCGVKGTTKSIRLNPEGSLEENQNCDFKISL